jgi:aspartate aminotransferase
VALPASLPHREMLFSAMAMLNRTLGFVNAPALMQRVIARCADRLCDVSFYRQNRDLLCNALREYGYELTMPSGAFYAFPRTPLTDDVEFVNLLLKERILVVPGRGFGRPGYMRVSYCVDRQTIERGLPGFKRALEAAR